MKQAMGSNVPNKGDKYPTWFSGSPDGHSTVIDVRPYTGRYPQHFTHILRLSAPRTQRGWLEQTVKLFRPETFRGYTP